MQPITLNGEARALPHEQSLAEFLSAAGYNEGYFAVAINGDFVPRGLYSETQLKGGEALEILSPRQGG